MIQPKEAATKSSEMKIPTAAQRRARYVLCRLAQSEKRRTIPAMMDAGKKRIGLTRSTPVAEAIRPLMAVSMTLYESVWVCA